MHGIFLHPSIAKSIKLIVPVGLGLAIDMVVAPV
jgi:hypothetical protein